VQQLGAVEINWKGIENTVMEKKKECFTSKMQLFTQQN